MEAKKKESEDSQSEKEKFEPEVPHNYSTRRNRHNPDDFDNIPPVV